MKKSLNVSLPDYSNLLPRGELAERLRKSVDHLDQMPRSRLVRDLAHPDRIWSFGADFPGRWLEVMSVISRLDTYHSREFGIYQAVRDLCKFQRADGMFGKDTMTGYACAGRGLMGLVEAYASFGYPEALEAATKLIDYLTDHFPPRPTQRACMGIRDIVRYAEVTGQERALILARRMYDDCIELGPECPFKRVSGNLHIFIYDHRGLLALYQHTGDEDLLQQAIAFQRWVLEHKAWVSGGVPERLIPSEQIDASGPSNEDSNFFTDADEDELPAIRDETCTVADWMMLNLELGLLTGDDRYAATAEHTFWNHFLFGQADNGGWCAHRNLMGLSGEVWDFCCSHHGTRWLVGAMRHTLIRHDDGLRLNLHLPVGVRFSWPEVEVYAEVEFDPNGRDYAIVFGEGTCGEFAVRLRRPIWANDLRIIADGAGVTDAPDGDIVVAKRWHSGDRIACQYAPAIAIHADSTRPVARVAAQRGPLMLVATDFTTDNAPTVEVSCEEELQRQRIIIDLDGRFAAIVGEFRVDPHYVDWDHPDRGITFKWCADGSILPCSLPNGGVYGETAIQGWSSSHVIGTEVEGKQQLVIEIASNHPGFPVSAAHVTSLRLFTQEGAVAFVDPYLSGGRTPIHNALVDRQQLVELLSGEIGQWPVPVKTKDGRLSLRPMKDLASPVHPEAVLGFHGPLASSDFTVLLPVSE